MADVRTDMQRETVTESSMVLHWSAILGGSFVALGTWLFLLALGAAIQGNSGPNTWTAIYNLVAPIIALFVGGMVAARSRLVNTRFDGLLHGAVIWGFTMAVGALLSSVIGNVLVSATQTDANRTLPQGFTWAIAASILGSLIAALLGTASTAANRTEYHQRRDVPREANP